MRRTTTSWTKNYYAGRIAHIFGLHSPSALIMGTCWCQRKLPTRNVDEALLKQEELARAAFNWWKKESKNGQA